MPPFPPKAADILDVPPEVAKMLDEVLGEPDEVVPEKPAHKPPLGDDMVLLPKHYARYQIEPIRFIAENKLDWFQSNVTKYTARAPFKHKDKGLQDLTKVVRYTIMQAKFYQGDPDWWREYRNPQLHRLIVEEMTYRGR